MNELISNETDMLGFAAQLAKNCAPPLIIYLVGDLGAGKTTFARGFLSGLGYQGRVKSPTYTIVEPYHFKEFEVFHFDLYRIHESQELELLGIRDYFHDKAMCLIEWPENGQGFIAAPDLVLTFQIPHTGRSLDLTGCSMRGIQLIKQSTNKLCDR